MMTHNLLLNRAATLVKCAQAAIALIASLLFAGVAYAGEGHDHGDAAPAASAGAGSPRVSSHSDLFELVGIVDGSAMTIYIDRHATNEPVIGAKVEVEAGSAKVVAAPQPDGTYRFEHPILKEGKPLAVSFTVVAGADSDLLAGDLDLANAHAEHDDDHAARPWVRWFAWAAGALLLLALALAGARRLRLPVRPSGL